MQLSRSMLYLGANPLASIWTSYQFTVYCGTYLYTNITYHELIDRVKGPHWLMVRTYRPSTDEMSQLSTLTELLLCLRLDGFSRPAHINLHQFTSCFSVGNSWVEPYSGITELAIISYVQYFSWNTKDPEKAKTRELLHWSLMC